MAYGGFTSSDLANERRLPFTDSSFWGSDWLSVISNVDKPFELGFPLGNERSLGNDDERWKTDGSNKIGSDDGFAETRRCRHDSVFIAEHLFGGNLLFRAKSPFKCHHNWIARLALVRIVGSNAGFLKQPLKLSLAASGNRDAAVSKFAEVYVPRFAEYRLMHRLRAEEFWVGKCCKPANFHLSCGTQRFFGDIEHIGLRDGQR